MNVEMDRKMLLTLVEGVRPPMHKCDELTRQGAMQFTGNQHNPDWCWDAAFLKRLTDDELMEIYKKCRR